MRLKASAIISPCLFVFMMCISVIAADIPDHMVPGDWLFIPVPGSQIVARSVTTSLPQIVGSDDELRDRLGFSSLSQVSALILPDPPFAVFRIGLSRLKNFDPTNPMKLFLEEENWFQNLPVSFLPARYLFPIREPSRPSGGCARPSLIDFPGLGCIASSVQVKLMAGAWEFQQIGRPGLIKKLSQFGNGATHFVVWIPVLNVHYLARLDLSTFTPELKIKAIATDRYVINPGTSKLFEIGEELSGNEVFEQLKLLAQSIDPNGPPG